MKRIPEDVLSAIAARVLPGLAYLHSRHMVRRTEKVSGAEARQGCLVPSMQDSQQLWVGDGARAHMLRSA